MKRITILCILFLLVGGAAVFWSKRGASAVSPSDKSQKIFVVLQGQGVREIANSLKKEKLINDPVVFFLLVKRMGVDGKIQAGDFRLSPSMTAREIAENLTHGTLDVWITILEGIRAEEIADILAERIPSFDPSWRTELNKHEGYLFPDTYLIPKDADIELVLSLFTNTFEQKYATLGNPTHKLTRSDIVTVASLVEREARFAEDRPLVASVIINRVTIGMKLDIDATIQYALGHQEQEKRWWKKSLSREDLRLNSDYNTYLSAGLPPTPIANPGLAALDAAMRPANTNYLYYISDKSGRNHYAETLEEHNENIAKYGP